MDQKLLILVTYHAKPGRGREFLREIEKHGLRETILKEDGCLRYDYYLASDTDDTVLLVEQWQTPAHQSAHMAQAHMKTLLELKNREILSTDVQKYLNHIHTGGPCGSKLFMNHRIYDSVHRFQSCFKHWFLLRCNTH